MCSVINDQNMAKRNRNFATIVYPSSELTVSNWVEILENTHIPALISPLHDKDKTTTGEEKKVHHHVVLLFESVKTREQAQEIFELIGGVGVEPVNCIGAYSRYLCHLDNPEKAQYDVKDIISLSGARYQDIIENSTQDKYEIIGEIIDFCEERDIVSYAELLSYSRKNNKKWFRCLVDSTLPILTFLKSRQWEHSITKQRTINKEKLGGSQNESKN